MTLVSTLYNFHSSENQPYLGIYAGIASLLALLVYGFLGVSFKSTTKYPNGPQPLPLIGNLFSLRQLQAAPEPELLKIAKRYGQICMMWFGSNPIVIVNSPKTIKELMDKRGAVYSSRPAQNHFREMAWPWRLVTTPTGETFRILRKIYHNLLGPQQSMHFRKYQDYESTVMLCDVLENPEGFLNHTERFAMSVIFSAVYGVRLVQLDHPIMVEFYAVWEVMLQYFQPGSLMVDFFPILQKLPHAFQPWLKLAKTLRERECRLHRAFLRTLRTQSQEGNAPDCFGTKLVQIQDQEDINDEKAMDILAMLIGAGADTTSSVLQSFFKVMALHPEALQTAHEELDRVIGPNRLPGWDDEYSLPYIRALIKEVHRWAPIGSLGVPHATSKDDVYEGQNIPEGTVVFPNLTALSRSSDRYESPELFLPERFIDDHLDASASALHSDWRKRDHFHYGFGRRLCQGIFVAEASLYIVISRIIWAFDITEKPGCALDMDAKIAGLVTKPKPFMVTIKSRSPAHEAVLRREMDMAVTEILNFDDIVLEKA